MKRTLSTIAALALTGSLALIATPSQAKDSDVQGTATCTTGVKAKFKAGPRDVAQIKSNVQVDDAGRIRRVWTVTVTDGTQTLTQTATTAGASNEINLDFFTSDNPGSDVVTFVATRVGAQCTGTVTVP